MRALTESEPYKVHSQSMLSVSTYRVGVVQVEKSIWFYA